MFEKRLATRADVRAILTLRFALLRELGEISADGPEPALAAATERYLEEALDSGEFLCWLATAAGAPVASCGAVTYRRPPTVDNLSGLDMYIMNVYTSPPWRGRGLARELVGEAIAYAAAQNIGRVWLRTTEAGRRLYLECGFEPMPVAMVLHVKR
jgi:GNAT superfamily N-acetyltransferase